MLGLDEARLPAVLEGPLVAELLPDPEARFLEAVAWPVEQGLGRLRAERDLDFMGRYLIDIGLLTLAPPPEDGEAAPGARPDSPWP